MGDTYVKLLEFKGFAVVLKSNIFLLKQRKFESELKSFKTLKPIIFLYHLFPFTTHTGIRMILVVARETKGKENLARLS